MENNITLGFSMQQAWKMVGMCVETQRVDNGLILGMDCGEDELLQVGLLEEGFRLDEFLSWYEANKDEAKLYLEGIVLQDHLVATTLGIPKEQSEPAYQA